MIKKIIYLLVFTFSVSTFSQKSDITSAIIALDNKKDLQSAKKWIDVATGKIDNGSILKPKFMAKYYHYRGLIYLKLFQEAVNSEEIITDRFNLLDIAMSSFLTDAISKSSFSKKSINQLNVCSYLYVEGAYQDNDNKKFKEALAKFSKAISINSSEAIQKVDTFNMYNAALMAFNANEYDQSILWSKKLIEIDALDERFHIRLIDAYSETGSLELQLEAIQSARKSIPGSKEMIFKEVNYYLASGQNDLLLESLDNAVKSDPDNPVLHLVLGNTYSQLGAIEKAESSYKQSVLLDPNYFDAHNNLASLYLDQTISLIEKINNLDYGQTSLFNKYKKQRNDLYNLAVPYLEKCLKLEPTNIGVTDALKEIYYKLDNAKASVSMKKLSELPDSAKGDFVKDFFNQ